MSALDRPGGPAASRGQASRVAIVGCSGSGKTRLSRYLARTVGLPTYHLDDEHFGPGWEMLTDEVWAAHQELLTSGEKWIIEGNWIATIPIRVARAELVVMLDESAPRCLYRVTRRVWRILRGDHSALPARIRAEAEAGRPFTATSDFHQLLWTIVRFRLRTWRKVVNAVHTHSSAPLIVAVAPGLAGHRTASVRRRLRRLGVTATIIAPADVRTAVLEAVQGVAAGRTSGETAARSTSRHERGSR